jgi:hypothetical protein
MTDLSIFHFNINLLTFMLEPKISKPLETNVIQFTSGHSSIICSPNSQIFVTIHFLHGFSKRLLSKRFHHLSALCICVLPILNYIVYSLFRSMFDQIAVIRTENRSSMAPVAVTANVTGSEGSEVFVTSLLRYNRSGGSVISYIST